jgi:hypothetical protein
LFTSLPVESLRQSAGAPNIRTTSSEMPPKAQRFAFASVSCLPRASNSSAVFGAAAPTWSKMSLR